MKCNFRFSTHEETEILDLTVVKRDGRKEVYSREKMEHGLRKAFEKRPITVEEFRKLVNLIERDIQKKRKSEIKTGEIGEIVMKHLAKVDQVAYIRFASVYRSFKDVRTFQRELVRLAKGRRGKKVKGKK